MAKTFNFDVALSGKLVVNADALKSFTVELRRAEADGTLAGFGKHLIHVLNEEGEEAAVKRFLTKWLQTVIKGGIEEEQTDGLFRHTLSPVRVTLTGKERAE